jgi:hypothetical protein
MPPKFCVWGGIGALVAGAGYLWLVRGTVILADLSAAMASVLCL